MSAPNVDLLIDREDLRSITWRPARIAPLGPNQARLRVDTFALTANNITYARLGEKMRYWDFFPAPEGFGRLPVWGFADVAESRVDGLSAGERIYGYFPISSELVVSVGTLSPTSFVDRSPRRAPLAVAYNEYLRVSDDPQFAGVTAEAVQAIFRPLFTTAFLIREFLVENAFFGASSVLLSSASSKTALALAYLLGQAGPAGRRIVGLTSARNGRFVAEAGAFDQVLDYGDIGGLEPGPWVFVDMAGSAKVRGAVHQRLANDLRYSCAVGASHWEDLGSAAGLPGPRPTVFFAPDHVRQKSALWGEAGYGARLAEAWAPFRRDVERWVTLSAHRGPAAVEALYHDVLDGVASPRHVPVAALAG